MSFICLNERSSKGVEYFTGKIGRQRSHWKLEKTSCRGMVEVRQLLMS